MILQHTPLFVSQWTQAYGCVNQSFIKETFMKHGKKILELTVEPWEQSISKIALEQ